MEHSFNTSDKMQSGTKWAEVGAGVDLGDVNGKANHHRRGGWSFLTVCFCSPTLSSLQLSFNLSLFPDSSSSVSTVGSQSRLLTALWWLCGMERKKEGEDVPAPPPDPESAARFLEEKPRLKTLVNINLVICLAVTAFIVGYWA